MPSRSAITVNTELAVIIIILCLLIVTLQPVKVNMVTAPKYNKYTMEPSFRNNFFISLEVWMKETNQKSINTRHFYDEC